MGLQTWGRCEAVDVESGCHDELKWGIWTGSLYTNAARKLPRNDKEDCCDIDMPPLESRKSCPFATWNVRE